MRAILAVMLLLAATLPGAHGLGLLEDATTPDHRQVRVALDQGDLEARALSGTPRIDGASVPETWGSVGQAPTPWEGFERTVVLRLAGTGRLMLADDASGLVLELEQAGGSREPGHAPGSASEDPGPPSPPMDAARPSKNGTLPADNGSLGASEALDPLGRGSLDETSHTAEPSKAPGGLDWLLVGLIVGLGAIAVAPSVAGPIKRRLWQARSVAWRIWRRHRGRGPRKP